MADDAVDLGFTLLPADDAELPPDADLAAAAASALEDPLEEVPGEAPEPYGRTWTFDFEAGRFTRAGTAPLEARGLDALRQWCLMAVYSAHLAHAVFPEDFGMERPDRGIGELDGEEEAQDYGRRLEEALLVHDRIVSVDDYEGRYDEDAGVIYVDFTVVTDEEEPLRFEGVAASTIVED